MHFVWFLVALVLFEVLFWYCIFLALTLAGTPAQRLLVFSIENVWRRWVKWLLLPVARVCVFLFGTLLPVFVYGGTLGLIASRFAQGASFPLVYWVIGGVGAFCVAAPSGQTTPAAMLLSLGSFFLVVYSNAVTGPLSLFLEIVLTVLIYVTAAALFGLICYGLWLACNWALEQSFLRDRYQNMDALQRGIALFKAYLVLNLLWLVLSACALILSGIWLGHSLTEPPGNVMLYLCALVALMLYIILLSRIYVVADGLSKRGVLSTSGFSRLIIAILSTILLTVIGGYIVAVLLWVKCNRYLKTETTPKLKPSTCGVGVVENETDENG